MVKDYPFAGLGQNDKTLDIDPKLKPDFIVDVVLQAIPDGPWDAILCDPPYTDEDAKKYGEARCPTASGLLKKCLDVVRVGGKVGMLHYMFPRPYKETKLVACVGVVTGYNNRIRCFSVYERP